MYLIAKLFEQLNARVTAQAGKKVDVQFFYGTLPELNARHALGEFTLFMDFPDLSYNSSGAGYGGQLVTLNFTIMIQIRDQDKPIKHLKIIDQVVRWLHNWKPEEGEFTPLVRVAAGVDDRFDYPRVYRVDFKCTATDRTSEALEWSQTNDTEETAVDLGITTEVVESLEV
jgi:hypothetical protein